MKKNVVIIIEVTLILLFGVLIYIDYSNNRNIINDDTSNKAYNNSSIKDIYKKEKYYIEDNYSRYVDYKNSHFDLSIDEIIKRVNSNIDYDYYTHVDSTDLSKKSLIIVNKYNKLSADYNPNLVLMDTKYSVSNRYMEAEAYENFKELVNKASLDGFNIYNISSYRDYYLQEELYNNYVSIDGVKEADTYSARPGFSEHQTGLATDIITTNDDFKYTKEYEWLKNNSYKYGLILRYPEGKEYITGYQFEPWHYRYVGKEVAKYIYENDIIFEEYYAYFVK